MAVRQALAKQEPEVPEAGAYLWDWFREIVGQDALSYQEIAAWSRLSATPLRAWEALALMAMDRARSDGKPADPSRHEAEMKPATDENLKRMFRRMAKRKGAG